MLPYGRKNGKRKERIPFLPFCGEVVLDRHSCMYGWPEHCACKTQVNMSKQQKGNSSFLSKFLH